MKTVTFVTLLVLILTDGAIKYSIHKKNQDINIIIESIVNRITWSGYFILLISLFGVVILVDSIIINIFLILVILYIISKQVIDLKLNESN
jgi:hypothetical protein